MNKNLLTISQVFLAITWVLYLIYGALIFTMLNIGPIFSLSGSIIGIGLLVIATLYIIIFIRMGQAKDNPYMKTEILIWSILLIITSNIFAGVFGLIAAITETSGSNGSSENSLEKRLRDLDNLFDRGLITLEEYHERRKRIIEAI